MGFAEQIEVNLQGFDFTTTEENGTNITKIIDKDRYVYINTDVIERFPTEVDIVLCDKDNKKFVIYDTDINEDNYRSEVGVIISVIKKFFSNEYQSFSRGLFKKKTILEFQVDDRKVFANQSNRTDFV